MKLICLEYIKEDVHIRDLFERLNQQDVKAHERLQFERKKTWREAA